MALPSRNARRILSEERGVRRINRGLIAETGQIPTGMQLIQDTFSFEVLDKKDAIIEGVGGQEEPVMRVMGLFQLGDTQNANGRVYGTHDVLSPAVREIQEDVGHRAVMGEFDHPCFTVLDCRILTTNGWKEFADIRVGEFVWSRVNGRMVKSRVTQVVNDEYDGVAYRVRGKNIDIEFTPGHRFLFEKRPDRKKYDQFYATVEHVYNNRLQYNHVRIPQTATYDVPKQSTITIPRIDDCELKKDIKYYKGDIDKDLILDAKLFCSFLGLYLAEGGVKNNTVQIDQKNENGRCLVKELLEEIGLPFAETDRGFHIVDKRLANYLRPLGNVYSKHIPENIKQLDSECLENLVFWFAIGDGRMLKGGRNDSWTSNKSQFIGGGTTVEANLDLGTYSRIAIFTVSKKLIQDLHECVIKTGRCGRLSEITADNDYIFADHIIKAENKTTLYQLHISRNKGFNLDSRFTAIEPFHHKGRIYCLTTEHGNFYMEHKGLSFWTGNSDAKIHLDRVSHLISKIWMDGRKVYGEAEVLHRTPMGSTLRGLFEHKVRVGISSRGVGDMEVSEHNGSELYRVLPGYAFVTWDAVAEPSVGGAILNIQEGLNKRLRPLKKEQRKLTPSAYQNLLVNEIDKFFGLGRRKKSL